MVSCVNLPEADVDELPLKNALIAAGIDAQVVGWDDPTADWSRTRLAVLRACWNYPQHVTAFRSWLETAAAQTQLLNPIEVVQWNMHKGYLLELAARDIPVTPTALFAKGASSDLRATVAERGWTDVVVKPAISASSWQTKRVTADAYDEGQAHLDALTRERDALVQAFLPSVESYGERSLVVIDGEVCHAMRKAPRFMDDHETVSHKSVPITDAEEALAHRALAAVPKPVMYARVDIAPGPDGEPMLMELELIEPSLWFDKGPLALERMVAAIAKRLQ